MYGYRYDEVELPPLGPVDPSFKLVEYEFLSGKTRKPTAVSLGSHYDGACLFYPDTSHPGSLLMGVTKRIACDMPPVDLELFSEFMNFSIKIIHDEFSHCILTQSDDLTVETWLDKAPYTQKRKAQLQRTSEMREVCKAGDMYVKSHCKREPYVAPKWFRGIYSRSDFFKTQIGPVCAEIGDRLFNHPAFIKKIPVADRPQAIIDRFSVPGLKMAANDFTSFESMFKQLQMCVELYFFYFCTQYLGNSQYYFSMMRNIKQGVNSLLFKKWLAKLIAKRYSGEMDTSSMNGLFNYLLIRFLNFKSGETHDILPFLEGDDSLNPYFGKLDETILVRLGALAKLEYFDDVFSASFCGMVFSESSKQIITDPVKAVLGFGWSSEYYLRSNTTKLLCLLRAKSLSMLHTFPGCPILAKMALYGIRCTPQQTDRDLIKVYCRGSAYVREKLLNAINSKIGYEEPTIETRLLVEELYKVTVSQQFEIEKYFDSLTSVQPLSHPILDGIIGLSQRNHYDAFVHKMYPSDLHYL